MAVDQRALIPTRQDVQLPARRPLPDAQLPEIGRLRLGAPQEQVIRNGKPATKQDGSPVMKMGRPLDHFRATAPYKDDLAELAKVYGDPQAITPWDSPDGPQWQTVLTVDELRIALPPSADTLIGPRYETYNAGHYMTRYCDGRVCWVPNKQAQAWEPKPCICSPEEPECAQVTRLKVVVLGVPARGVWRIECHGAYAARHWPAQVEQARIMAEDGHPVPATIRIEAKSRRSAVHGRANFKVPVLRLAAVFAFGDAAPVIAAAPTPLAPRSTGDIHEADYTVEEEPWDAQPSATADTTPANTTSAQAAPSTRAPAPSGSGRPGPASSSAASAATSAPSTTAPRTEPTPTAESSPAPSPDTTTPLAFAQAPELAWLADQVHRLSGFTQLTFEGRSKGAAEQWLADRLGRSLEDVRSMTVGAIARVLGGGPEDEPPAEQQALI